MATTPAEKTPAKAPAKAPAKKPQDRQTSKAEQQREQKKAQQMLADMLSAGLDLSDFTIDAGDGVEWHFTPDPMPADTARLMRALDAFEASTKSVAEEGMDPVLEATDELVESIRARMTVEKQKEEFPLPRYGTKALQFFALHLATGRDGFPTEEV